MPEDVLIKVGDLITCSFYQGTGVVLEIKQPGVSTCLGAVIYFPVVSKTCWVNLAHIELLS